MNVSLTSIIRNPMQYKRNLEKVTQETVKLLKNGGGEKVQRVCKEIKASR